MLFILSLLLLFVLVLAGLLAVKSPGKPLPFLDEKGDVLPGSISEKIHININGVEQGMFIKSRDSAESGPSLPAWRDA